MNGRVVTGGEERQHMLLELKAILENADIGILFMRDRKVQQCNPACARLFGWPEAELLGQPGSVFYLNESDYAQMGQIAAPILGAGKLLDVEYRMSRRDGSAVLCRVRAKAVNPANTAEGTIWILDDITERRRAENELQDLLLRQEAILENASVGILFTNEGVVHHCNPRAEELLGWPAGTLAGQPTTVFFVDDEDFRQFAATVGPRLAAGERVDVVWHNVRKSGERVWCRHLAQALTSTDGARSTIWITEDVSERKAAQEALERAHRELEQRVRERTEALALANQQLTREIAEGRAKEQEIARLAYHDALTGLPNRLLLEDRFTHAVAHARRTNNRFALLFIDLDNFKRVNDSLGHAVGDDLLVEVALRLKMGAREADTVSRQGGDEFVVLLEDMESKSAVLAATAKLVARLQEPFVCDGKEIATSASIGVCLFPDDGEDFETLRKKADIAMYRAKESGRNTFQCFDEVMNAGVTEHLVLRNALHRALERKELALVFQPQIELATGNVMGAEALLRWNHPQLGAVSPARFIPVAEETGLILPIGEWALQAACTEAVGWGRMGWSELIVAVNLSAVQFRRGQLMQTVAQVLGQTGLSPTRLELELTESILIQNVDSVMNALRDFKQLGVQLSIDDFGTGYSSLSYLKRFDIDKLKIDQSFVRDLGSNADDAAIVNAIIQLARSLKLRTIAEGVETPEVAQRLLELGCDEAQGYWFARPMPADQFRRFLHERRAGGSRQTAGAAG